MSCRPLTLTVTMMCHFVQHLFEQFFFAKNLKQVSIKLNFSGHVSWFKKEKERFEKCKKSVGIQLRDYIRTSAAWAQYHKTFFVHKLWIFVIS